MNSEKKIPVIAGAGQVLQKNQDPSLADEPLQLMINSLVKAGKDSGAPNLLQQADSIYVVRGVWDYGNPGKEIARKLRASPSETVGTPYGGNFSHSCIIEAARNIQSGRNQVVLITGSENGYSRMLAERQGIQLHTTEVPGTPSRMIAADKKMVHEAELVRGIDSASYMYAIIESTIRFSRGESITDHMQRISKLWEGFSTIAQNNPNAWIRKPYSAEEISSASDTNPMISFPYTRLMNANPRVDMSAGIILCSLETAQNAGVPEDQIVFIHAATETNESQYASTRAEFHRSPAMRIAGNRVLELAGKSINEIDYLDLYSCFPSAVQIVATELGITEDRPLTVTGGLTFGGGPLNDYVLHSVARMVEVLREDRGSYGLVTANGGWLAKHAFGIYSTNPPTDGFKYENLQEQLDKFPQRETVVYWEGPVTIEGYTVSFMSNRPHVGYLACLLADGRRTWGLVYDRALLDNMTAEEFCGRHGHLDSNGILSIE